MEESKKKYLNEILAEVGEEHNDWKKRCVEENTEFAYRRFLESGARLSGMEHVLRVLGCLIAYKEDGTPYISN